MRMAHKQQRHWLSFAEPSAFGHQGTYSTAQATLGGPAGYQDGSLPLYEKAEPRVAMSALRRP